MDDRNAASVLPDPVGAIRSVLSPFLMTGQAWACAGVGPPGNEVRNHSRTAGWNASSTSLPMERGYRSAEGARPGDRRPLGAPGDRAGRHRRRGGRPRVHEPLDAGARRRPDGALRALAPGERPRDWHLGPPDPALECRPPDRGHAD